MERKRWLNWIMRHREPNGVVGTVQATLHEGAAGTSAEIAWIVAAGNERRGYAKESAGAMVRWLRRHGADVFVAHIHPEHQASANVARYLGLEPTNAIRDGEVRWTSRPPEPEPRFAAKRGHRPREKSNSADAKGAALRQRSRSSHRLLVFVHLNS
jgi:RimJ/RimL family protein N-acetyltransferase